MSGGFTTEDTEDTRRVHKWTRLEHFERAGRGPPLVREVNSRTSPHLRPSLGLGFCCPVQFMDRSTEVGREGFLGFRIRTLSFSVPSMFFVLAVVAIMDSTILGRTAPGWVPVPRV